VALKIHTLTWALFTQINGIM